MTQEELDNHFCEPMQKYPKFDAQNIFLCYICDECEEVKLSRFRPEILSGYNQLDIDEPIEPEE